MARKHRKYRKKLGQRTCGKGSHKKNRGSGNRGGTGRAGGWKSKWTYVVKYEPDRFGRHGFKLPDEVKNVYSSINIGEIDERIDELLEKGIAKEVEEGIEVDVSAMGFDKVLGGGKVTRALIVKAGMFSESAVRKIEESGGKAVVIE